MTDTESSATVTVGGKYHEAKGLDVAAVAQLVRRDLRAAGMGRDAVSVRIDRYSMGQSIDVYLKPEWVAQVAGGDLQVAVDYVERVRVILDAYNRRESDVMTDYFDTNFHGSVGIGRPGEGCVEDHNLRHHARAGKTLAEVLDCWEVA